MVAKRTRKAEKEPAKPNTSRCRLPKPLPAAKLYVFRLEFLKDWASGKKVYWTKDVQSREYALRLAANVNKEGAGMGYNVRKAETPFPGFVAAWIHESMPRDGSPYEVGRLVVSRVGSS